MTAAETQAEVEACNRLSEERSARDRQCLELIDIHLARIAYLTARAHFRLPASASAEDYRLIRAKSARSGGGVRLRGKALRTHRALVRKAREMENLFKKD